MNNSDNLSYCNDFISRLCFITKRVCCSKLVSLFTVLDVFFINKLELKTSDPHSSLTIVQVIYVEITTRQISKGNGDLIRNEKRVFSKRFQRHLDNSMRTGCDRIDRRLRWDDLIHAARNNVPARQSSSSLSPLLWTAEVK